jgi:MFS family permease
VALIVILVAAPEVHDAELKPLGLAGLAPARLAFLAAITGLLVLLAVGTLRRWRWMFWLLLVAFPAGILRLPLWRRRPSSPARLLPSPAPVQGQLVDNRGTVADPPVGRDAGKRHIST